MRPAIIKICLVLLVLAGSLVGWLEYAKPEQIVQKRRRLEVLLKASHQLGRLWREGQQRCRPAVFDELEQLVVWQGKKKQIVALEKGPWISRLKGQNPHGPQLGYQIQLTYREESLQIILSQECAETFLPERRYAYGEYSKNRRDNFRWDNFGQKIFIDRYLVSNRDLKVWSDLGLAPKAIQFDAGLPDNPALKLTKSQMLSYCAFRGKQLMQAHILDAASFHPMDIQNVRPKSSLRNPYPWTRKKGTFLNKALNDKGSLFKKEYCKKIFTSECGETALLGASVARSRSWMGMYQVLGGQLEAVRNAVQPKYNLKASSQHFDIHSAWHKIGKRAYWDGVGHTERNFGWKRGEVPSKYPLGVGFRCFRRLL